MARLLSIVRGTKTPGASESREHPFMRDENLVLPVLYLLRDGAINDATWDRESAGIVVPK